jgi:multisubunit Na+/H+ antiporter MnhB subunit
LIAIGVLLVILMAGVGILMLYGGLVDLRFAREAWRKLDHKHRRAQVVALLVWLFGIVAAFGIGYAIGGNWEGGAVGAAAWGVGLAVISPLLVLGAREKP